MVNVNIYAKNQDLDAKCSILRNLNIQVFRNEMIVSTNVSIFHSLLVFHLIIGV